MLLVGFLVVSLSYPIGWASDTYAQIKGIWPVPAGLMIMTYYLIRIEADLHAQLFEEGVQVNHPKAWLIRVAVSLFLCSVIHAYYWHWAAVLTLMLFSMFWFGLAFNLTLNRKRSLPAFYIGKDWKQDSLIDSIFNNLKYGGEILFVLELIGFIVTSYVYLTQY